MIIAEDEKMLLARYLSEVRFTKWDQGQFDCCLFIADWIDRLTGVGWAKDIRGHYHDEKTAFRFARTLNPQKMMVGEDADKWKVPGFKEISADELPLAGDIWWYDERTHYSGVIIFEGLAWGVSSEHNLFKWLPEVFEKDLSPSGLTKRFRRI